MQTTLNTDLVLEEPTDVPPEWRDAFRESAMRDEYTGCVYKHPFYRRFVIDTAIHRETLGHLVHYMREYSTIECYSSSVTSSASGKRRAILNTNGVMTIGREHYTRLLALACDRGCHVDPLIHLDKLMRRKRDYSGEITTPEGRSFLYLYQDDHWIDVSYTTPRPLNSSSP